MWFSWLYLIICRSSEHRIYLCLIIAGRPCLTIRYDRYILATDPHPQKNSHICYCPPNFGGKRRAPLMAKNWFQAYLGLGMPQMEKSDEYIHVFMCSQTSGSSANFSWRHMQTGSRNPPKPEVVITRRREDISTWSQWLRHTHWACSIHLHLRQHRPTMENTIRCKPEVETVSKPEAVIT